MHDVTSNSRPNGVLKYIKCMGVYIVSNATYTNRKAGKKCIPEGPVSVDCEVHVGFRVVYKYCFVCLNKVKHEYQHYTDTCVQVYQNRHPCRLQSIFLIETQKSPVVRFS